MKDEVQHHSGQLAMRCLPDHPLWIGNARDAGDMGSLHGQGIRAVVQLAYEEPPVPGTRDLILQRFPLEEGDGNEPHLLSLAITSVATLVALRIPTLVACSNGMSRSPCVVAAALALVQCESPDTCLARVLHGGPADVSTVLWNDVVRIVSGLQWVFPKPAV